MRTDETTTALGPDWEIPEGLTLIGRLAAETIRDYAVKHGLTWTGGQKVFHHPKDWDGEHGKGSHLIVLHEGGSYAHTVSMDYAYDSGSYRAYEALQRKIDRKTDGGFLEGMTRWYSAVHHRNMNANY